MESMKNGIDTGSRRSRRLNPRNRGRMMTCFERAKTGFAWLLLASVVGCGASQSNPEPDMEAVAAIRKSLAAGNEGGAAAETASAAQPTGFGTLRGKFILEGDVPSLPTVTISKDNEVCAPGGKTIYSQDVVVDQASKGLANVLIFAENVPVEWVHESAKPGKTDEVVFDQKECIFLTHLLAIQTSQPLRALNSDPVGHNLMVGSFNQTIPSGGFAIYKPAKEMRIPAEMRCAIHPWMKAWFINRDNGYFAVTEPDGSFTIPNLPAGVPLEFRVWQEALGAVKDVTVDGKATTWPKGKLTLTLEPDSETDMSVTINATSFK